MTSKPNLKRKAEEILEYPGHPKWMLEGSKQKIISRTYHVLEPTAKVPEDPIQIEFNLKDFANCWAMGANTYFEIGGQFQEAIPAAQNVPAGWKAVSAQEAAQMTVQPNWLGALIRKVEVSHGNIPVNTSDEGAYVSHFLDSFQYAVMNKTQKKKLCIHNCHPAYGVPTKKGGWMTGDGTEWNEYSKTVFKGDDGSVLFNWKAPNIFPTTQGKNYEEADSKVLPMPALKPIDIRILLRENKGFIFRNDNGNNKTYRFAFKKFNFCYEKLWLNPKAQTSLLAHKSLDFPGVTRITRRQNITAGNTTYHTVIQNIPFPEGLFIFALPKAVPSGAYEYKNNTNGDVFLPHNISSVKFAYGNLNFFTETLDIGMINKTLIENKLISDYREFPPFGLSIDEGFITLANIENGSNKTPYPHVFINLLADKDGSRLIPKGEKVLGSVLKPENALKMYNNLDLTLTFNQQGATADSTYFVYMYYTDVMATIHLVKGNSTITNPYIVTTTN